MAARIIEPTSELDSARVLEETDVAPASFPRSTGAAGLCQILQVGEAAGGARARTGRISTWGYLASLPVLEPQP